MAALLKTNAYLRDKKTTRELVMFNARESSEFEGVHVRPFSINRPRSTASVKKSTNG